MYAKYGNKESIFLEDWPEYDVGGIVEEKYTLIVQINGKLRARIDVNKGIEQDEALSLAREVKNVDRFFENAEPKKIIFVKDRLLNIVF
jgi:leucyl-tRNA synthetase